MFAALFIILGIIAFTIVYVGGVAVFEGWVLTKLWAWFLVPLLSVKPITIAYAIGISLIIRLLTYQIPYQDLKDENRDLSVVIGRLLVPFIGGFVVLGMGYLVHLYL